MERDLEGRVALVTGGTRGIGRAISLDLARRGANVVVVYFRKTASAEDTCRELEEQGVKALAVRAHIGDEKKLEAVFEKVGETFGRLDVFVSNAAQGVFKLLSQQDSRTWDWTLGTNAKGFFLGASHARRLMIDGGSIVAISSFGSSRVFRNYSLIGASKSAIESLVRYMAVEFGPHNIRVNAVSPSVVDTEELKIYPTTPELVEWQKRAPIPRLVTAQDVSDYVQFLTSDKASMITGQSVVIDGGAGLLGY